MRYDGFVALKFQFQFLRMRYRAEGRKTLKIYAFDKFAY